MREASTAENQERREHDVERRAQQPRRQQSDRVLKEQDRPGQAADQGVEEAEVVFREAVADEAGRRGVQERSGQDLQRDGGKLEGAVVDQAEREQENHRQVANQVVYGRRKQV